MKIIVDGGLSVAYLLAMENKTYSASVEALLKLQEAIALADAGEITEDELDRRQKEIFGQPIPLSESALRQLAAESVS